MGAPAWNYRLNTSCIRVRSSSGQRARRRSLLIIFDAAIAVEAIGECETRFKSRQSTSASRPWTNEQLERKTVHQRRDRQTLLLRNLGATASPLQDAQNFARRLKPSAAAKPGLQTHKAFKVSPFQQMPKTKHLTPRTRLGFRLYFNNDGSGVDSVRGDKFLLTDRVQAHSSRLRETIEFRPFRRNRPDDGTWLGAKPCGAL